MLKITGTFHALRKVFDYERLCDILGLDYYKAYMIPDDEIFDITEKMLEKDENTDTNEEKS